ncbi:unnamed protein product [Caenorhabditis bovis]|uniref:RING-type domain-containing protein n=1 Tax=Caenorhabditis bovis TaxID=2654633 RepID=A0A8S1F437_9PELO|nr:unnamed protein product [Caenorhabditis bovis]
MSLDENSEIVLPILTDDGEPPPILQNEFKVDIIPKVQMLKICATRASTSTSDLIELGTVDVIDDSEQHTFLEADHPDIYLTHDSIEKRKYHFYIKAPPEHIKKKSPWRGMSNYYQVEHLFTIDVEENSKFARVFNDATFLNTTIIHQNGIEVTYECENANSIRFAILLNLNNVFNSVYDAHNQKFPWLNTRGSAQESIPKEVDFDFDEFFKLHTKVRKTHLQNHPTPRYLLKEDLLTCNLLKYQRETIRWMIAREENPDIKFDDMFEAFEIKGRRPIYYFPRFGVFTKSKDIDFSLLAVQGGILADEMGLGKTVEIIGLIATRQMGAAIEMATKPDKMGIVRNERIRSGGIDELSHYKSFKDYEQAKKIDKSLGSAVVYTPLETDTRKKVEETLIKCNGCCTMCVAQKCNWIDEFNEIGAFRCPQCMERVQPLEIKATIIIVPESLVQQWFDEISKHCDAALKVMYYFGVTKAGYVHPYELAKQDVVLTTYETIRSELDFANVVESKRELRGGSQQYKFSPSPLTHVIWWRMVVDESQIVEGVARRVPQMCSKMQSKFHWCVTGTPLVKSCSDIYGLVVFLEIWPYSMADFWNKYIYPEYRALVRHLNDSEEIDNGGTLMNLLAQIMSRNTKEGVEKELFIPKLVEHVRLVRFTAIEERQYNEQKEHLKKKVEKLIGRKPDSVYLKDCAIQESVLTAMAKLKESLISSGEHINYCDSTTTTTTASKTSEKIVFGPETVVMRLISAKKTQIEENVRNLMSSFFGLAGVYYVLNNAQSTLNVLDNAITEVKLVNGANDTFNEALQLDASEFNNVISESDGSDSDVEIDIGAESMKENKLKQKIKKESATVRTLRRERMRRKQKEKAASSPSGEPSTSTEKRPASPLSDDSESDDETNVLYDQEKRARLTDDDRPASALVEKEEDRMARAAKLAEKKMERVKKELKKNACKPIRVDVPLLTHLTMRLKFYTYNENTVVRQTAANLMSNLGGMKAMIDELFKAICRYCRNERRTLNVMEVEWKEWMEEWTNGKIEVEHIKKYLEDFIDLHDDPESLEVARSISTNFGFFNTISQLSIVPMYQESRKHLNADYRLFNKTVYCRSSDFTKRRRQYIHEVSTCMGNCDGIPFERAYADAQYATVATMMNSLIEHFDGIEMLRRTFEKSMGELIKLFVEALSDDATKKTLRDDLMKSQANFSLFKDILGCDHALLDVRKNDILCTRSIEHVQCKLCRAAYDLAALQYESGFGTFHGVPKSKSKIRNVFLMIVQYEKKKLKSSLSSSSAVKSLRHYLKRLGKTIKLSRSALIIIHEYANRISELEQSYMPLSVEMLSSILSTKMKVFKKNSPEHVNIAKAHFLNDIEHFSSNNNQLYADLRYLTFLYKREITGEGADEECPICRTEFYSFAMFPCGHRVCDGCYKHLKRVSGLNIVHCPSCRKSVGVKSIMVAISPKDSASTSIPGVSLPVKLDNTIQLIREILGEDKHNKIIVFTTIEPGTAIWNFVCRIFDKALLPFYPMTRKDYGKKVFEFEHVNSFRVLLASFSTSANGLNLTIANNIIFLDPSHISSVVAQAIGRINRFGQTRPMNVYHMLVESSIDEELRLIATTGDSRRQRTGWTLGEIRQMFDLEPVT